MAASLASCDAVSEDDGGSIVAKLRTLVLCYMSYAEDRILDRVPVLVNVPILAYELIRDNVPSLFNVASFDKVASFVI